MATEFQVGPSALLEYDLSLKVSEYQSEPSALLEYYLTLKVCVKDLHLPISQLRSPKPDNAPRKTRESSACIDNRAYQVASPSLTRFENLRASCQDSSILRG